MQSKVPLVKISALPAKGVFPPWEVWRFWKRADRVFDTLNLSEQQLSRLHAAIEQRIGIRPTEEQTQAQDLARTRTDAFFLFP